MKRVAKLILGNFVFTQGESMDLKADRNGFDLSPAIDYLYGVLHWYLAA